MKTLLLLSALLLTSPAKAAPLYTGQNDAATVEHSSNSTIFDGANGNLTVASTMNVSLGATCYGIDCPIDYSSGSVSQGIMFTWSNLVATEAYHLDVDVTITTGSAAGGTTTADVIFACQVNGDATTTHYAGVNFSLITNAVTFGYFNPETAGFMGFCYDAGNAIGIGDFCSISGTLSTLRMYPARVSYKGSLNYSLQTMTYPVLTGHFSHTYLGTSSLSSLSCYAVKPGFSLAWKAVLKVDQRQ